MKKCKGLVEVQLYRVGIKVTDFTVLGAPLFMQSSPPLLQKKTPTTSGLRVGTQF